MQFKRVFTHEGWTVAKNVKWTKRDAKITKANGDVAFEQKGVEVPESWSNDALNIVASKYFKKINGVMETSVLQLLDRVVNTIVGWAVDQSYFTTPVDCDIFRDELYFLLANQYASFNSPVYFNFGVPGRPQQGAACFLLGVEDSMEAILDRVRVEGLIFKGGSGSGMNLSPLRRKKSSLSSGGESSGPMSFNKGYDAFAGVIKSGGTTRRAAKMTILNADHGDIEEFITCKIKEEKKAKILIEAGYDASIDGEAYGTVAFQNQNMSVRITDDFMHKAENGNAESVRILKLIADSAWRCGDPGVQFDTTINSWNTIPNSGYINTSNPCQPANATVLTPFGITTFASLKVGDIIWSGKDWTNVVHKVSTGVKPVYKYHTTAGYFLGTDKHRVVSNGEKIEVENAESIDLAVGPETLPCDLDLQAVVDGLVIGDGSHKICNDGANTYMLLHIGEDDKCYFDREIRSFIGNHFDGTAYRIDTTITPAELPKTYERFIPDRFRFAGYRTVISFLRGLFSANGGITGGERISLKAASKIIIMQVQEMLSSLGIRSYYTTNKPTKVQFSNGEYLCKQSYDLNITTDRFKFAKLIGFIHPYKTEKLAVVIEKIKPSGRPAKTSYGITTIEEMGEQEVFDITVDCPEHTYWTGGLLVSNCAEFLSTDWSSCQLASFNLLKFFNGEFIDLDKLNQAVAIFTTALDAIIDKADYPDPRFKETAHNQRQIGPGYSNLGALLMAKGLPYDSDEGRDFAAGITAYMTAASHLQSAKIAAELGAFSDFEKNKREMINVLQRHYQYCNNAINKETYALPHFEAAMDLWFDAIELGAVTGFRNATNSLVAPTGTISFMMDCDTTGIEPDFALVKYKTLVGGGIMPLVNGTVGWALRNLGYSEGDQEHCIEYIASTGSLEGCSFIDQKHLPIFDCANKPANGSRCIDYMAHVKMVAAVQPFLSMGVSKTINMPNSATVEDIYNLYFQAWKMGVKCMAVYRDGSKGSQPLNVNKKEEKVKEIIVTKPMRKELPKERPALIHKIEIANFEGYMSVGLYDDGMPAEIFITASKEGSTISGLLDAFAIQTSLALQYGVPLEVMIDKMTNSKFEPAGFTKHPDIKVASSIIDYIFKWMQLKFIDSKKEIKVDKVSINFDTGKGRIEYSAIIKANTLANESLFGVHLNGNGKVHHTGELCSQCGNPMIRTGTCLTCTCGNSLGGCGA